MVVVSVSDFGCFHYPLSLTPHISNNKNHIKIEMTDNIICTSQKNIEIPKKNLGLEFWMHEAWLRIDSNQDESMESICFSNVYFIDSYFQIEN